VHASYVGCWNLSPIIPHLQDIQFWYSHFLARKGVWERTHHSQDVGISYLKFEISSLLFSMITIHNSATLQIWLGRAAGSALGEYRVSEFLPYHSSSLPCIILAPYKVGWDRRPKLKWHIGCENFLLMGWLRLVGSLK